jgi:putative addiction module killer protein
MPRRRPPSSSRPATRRCGPVACTLQAGEVEILRFRTAAGRVPFDEWFESVRDRRARAAVLSRIARLGKGLAGDWRSVGSGVFELRVHAGPGYRVYFVMENPRVILLLCGGDKSTQSKDIEKAHAYSEENATRTW